MGGRRASGAGGVRDAGGVGDAGGAPPQEVRFCRSGDGTRIAWARHGAGPPLVVATCWLSHLDYDWRSPVWRHFLSDLGGLANVVRYDERGFGLSSWDVDDFSFEARLADLEAVVDAAGLDRFALLGMSQGGPISVAYAARHPERVSRLLLFGTAAAASAAEGATEEERQLSEAFSALIRVGWARPESEFRRVFTTMMIPGAGEEQMHWLDALQRMSTSTANALASREARQAADVRGLLGGLDVPTLVLHARGDRMNAFDGSCELATRIPGARLVALDSANHVLLEDEPAWPVFLDEVSGFLAPDAALVPALPAAGPDAGIGSLTARELDVLHEAAAGKDNRAIADALALSVRTVERHLQGAYLKLGVGGRSARAAAVARLLRAG